MQANAIKTYRETQKLSQGELGEKIGVTRFTIMRWEQDGKPDESKLKKIEEVTGIPAKELRPDLVEKHEEIFGGAQ
jgi:transcriptional regulator with XRE-family HTH domain